MPELKFVTTALPAANVVRPFTSPPVIKALPVLKFVVTSVAIVALETFNVAALTVVPSIAPTTHGACTLALNILLALVDAAILNMPPPDVVNTRLPSVLTVIVESPI